MPKYLWGTGNEAAKQNLDIDLDSFLISKSTSTQFKHPISGCFRLSAILLRTRLTYNTHQYPSLSRYNYFIYLLSVDGKWSEWSDWSICDQDCGDGVQMRTRTCSPPSAGKPHFYLFSVVPVGNDRAVIGTARPDMRHDLYYGCEMIENFDQCGAYYLLSHLINH